MSARSGHQRHTVPAPPATSRPATPVTMRAPANPSAMRWRTASAEHRRADHRDDGQRGVRGGGDRDGLEQLLADPGQAGGQRLVLRLEGVPLPAGTRESVAPSSTPSSSSVLVTSSRTPLALCNSYPMPGSSPVEPPPLEFVVEQLDDVVNEGLDRHRCRIHLRNEVFSTYDRNRATSRKRHLPIAGALVRPVGIWNIFVRQCRGDLE